MGLPSKPRVWFLGETYQLIRGVGSHGAEMRLGIRASRDARHAFTSMCLHTKTNVDVHVYVYKHMCLYRYIVGWGGCVQDSLGHILGRPMLQEKTPRSWNSSGTKATASLQRKLHGVLVWAPRQKVSKATYPGNYPEFSIIAQVVYGKP